MLYITNEKSNHFFSPDMNAEFTAFSTSERGRTSTEQSIQTMLAATSIQPAHYLSENRLV